MTAIAWDTVGKALGPAAVEGLRRLGRPPHWLTAAADGAQVGAALEAAVPEFSSGQLQLVRCKVKRAALDSDGWVTVARLRISADGGASRDVDLRGELLPAGDVGVDDAASAPAFDSAQWQCGVPELRTRFSPLPGDGALPAMPLLTDPGSAAELLGRSIRAGSPAYRDLTITGCTPEVMRHKPGRRCTIRYRLDYPAGADPNFPRIVVAKTYGSEEGRVAYEGMRALWQTPLRGSRTVTIAEPLAFLPDLNVLVQGPVSGNPLKNLLGTPAATEELLATVGRGLAELHGSGATAGSPVTWADQLGGLTRAADLLAARVPELGDAVTPLLVAMEEAATDLGDEQLVPSHRSFRPAQVLVNGADIGFIDFDGFCRSEPGLDIALFLFTLEDLSLRAAEIAGDESLDAARRRTAELAAAFLHGYAEARAISWPRLALWRRLMTLREVLDCWRKLKFEHLQRRVDMLVDLLAAAGQGPVG